MNASIQTRSVHVPGLSLEEMVGQAAQDLHAASADLVRAMPEPVLRAVDLERLLRLERKLAWQVFRISRSSGLNELANVPSFASAQKVFESAKARGVAPEVINRARNAFERFDTLTVEQFGDRASMLSMISGFSQSNSEALELRVRKSLFAGNAHVWGLKARMQVRTVIYNPCGSHGETLRGILVSGNLGLRGTRRSEPMVISSWLKPSPLDMPADAAPDQSVDQGAKQSTSQFELLPEYCSPNLPPMAHVPGAAGMVETEMVIPAAGSAGAVDLYFTQASATSGDARTVGAGAAMFISVPAIETVTELLVPAGHTAPPSVRVAVFGRRHHPDRARDERSLDLLPQRETAAYLGRIRSVPPIDGVPRHREVVDHVLASHGLQGMEFDAYRCRVQYPVMHTFVVMRVDGMKSR